MESQQGLSEQVSADIPWPRICLACGVILLEALAARLLELGNADQLLISGIRCFVQLSFLGCILVPIFETRHPCLVLGYIFGFMVMVSAHEAAARPKVTYPGIFSSAALSMGSALLLNGVLLLFIVAPDPWYDAQYLIPMAGMLINNSLSGTALALNSMIDYLHGSKEQVEVLLTFGATPREAAWPGFVKSIQAALIPAINGMNVVGLVSIPGMMTGQILGGASPMKAARYQIVITFLISGCTFVAVCSICGFTIKAFFDGRGRHDDSAVKEQSRTNVAKLFNVSYWRQRKASRREAETATCDPADAESQSLAMGRLDLVCSSAAEDKGQPVLEVELEGPVAKTRPLRASMQLNAREVVCIMGPSGIGKSTLLKWISDLKGGTTGRIVLQGRTMDSLSPQAWRQSVLYVHQIKTPLPGTPKTFIKAVEGLAINHGRQPLSVEPIMKAVGLDAQILERPWSELSGGEAQRTMLAIALATHPTCLLLDEPTSALDEASKQLVEQVLSTGGHASCTLLVTHDAAQAKRVGSSRWDIVER